MRGTQITRVDLSADRVIANGASIAVAGIVIANESMQPVSVYFEYNSGVNAFTVVVPGYDSKLIDWSFIADKGLNIDGVLNGSNIIVSVWHSAEGA